MSDRRDAGAERIRLLPLLAASLLLISRPLHAQVGIESLLGSITDLDISISCWNTSSDFLRDRQQCPFHSGWGVEAIFHITDVRLGPKPRPSPTDTTWNVDKRELDFSGGRVDSVRTYTAKVEPTDTRSSIQVELGLGYGQFTGFASSDTTFAIRGTVREIPALTVYGTWIRPQGTLHWLSPYVGVRTGVLQLHNVQLFQPGTADSVIVYKAAADVFQIGAVGGLSARSDKFPELMAFAEFGYQVRRFPSVEWNAASGGKILRSFPTSLDFTGFTFEMGFQFHIRDAK